MVVAFVVLGTVVPVILAFRRAGRAVAPETLERVLAPDFEAIEAMLRREALLREYA